MARYIKNYLTNENNKHQLLPANSSIENASLATQLNEYNTKLLERNSLVSHSSVKNPLVREMDKLLEDMRSALITSIDNQMVALRAQIKSLEDIGGQATSQIASNPKQSKYLLSVERQQKVKESLYTRERQRKRFPVLCYHLSKWLNVRDGFQTIWIEEEREQMKGTSHKDVVSNLSIKRRDINGMHVILFDDILTTGQSFKQLKRRMIDLGAKSVTGIFLGKTVWLND